MTLNRPARLNAADLSLHRRLLERWKELEADDRTRAVVLTGAGRAFCAGGDVALLGSSAEAVRAQREATRSYRSLVPTLLAFPAPVIAAVHGPALGFGAELVALCDVVVMGPDASLGDPHVLHGLGASPACQLIWPHLTSRAIAKELLMSGRTVGAEEAVRLGLANRLVPAGDELSEALTLARELAALPPQGVGAVKRSFNAPLLDEWTALESARA